MAGSTNDSHDDRLDALDRLAAVEAIGRLKARYFRSMDTKDWVGFADVFAPDAVMDMRDEAGEEIQGNEAIAAFVSGSIDGVVTVHHGHMPEITLESPTEATGIWAMEDRLEWPPGSPIVSMQGFGHYHERYVKLGGQWRIAHLRLSRLRRDIVLPED
ncbi:MAG: nuclear transport factor 2 family protein [Acidimicrobiales bacterium]|nr:nuclear transport factor 2 family protein [Acidimicrobiales bacterium]